MSKTKRAPSTKPEPRVANALLRCLRTDSKAAPLFEKVDAVPGLWVLELGPFNESSGWDEWLAETGQTLTRNEAFLKSLKDGSSEYTLHISGHFSVCQPVTIPVSKLQLLATCGIALELCQH